MGARNPTNRPPEILQLVTRSFALARALGLTISIHAGQPTSVDTPALLERHDLLGPDLSFVNGSAFTATEMTTCATHGVGIITAPENEMQLGTPPPLGLVLEAGIRPVVTTDSLAYGSSDMATQLRILLQSARERGVRGEGDVTLTTRDVFGYGNVNPARALGMADRVGSLVVGAQADIVLVNRRGLNMLGTADPHTDLVQMAHPGDVDTVIVGGRVIKQSGRLLRHDLPRLRRQFTRIQERLRASA